MNGPWNAVGEESLKWKKVLSIKIQMAKWLENERWSVCSKLPVSPLPGNWTHWEQPHSVDETRRTSEATTLPTNTDGGWLRSPAHLLPPFGFFCENHIQEFSQIKEEKNHFGRLNLNPPPKNSMSQQLYHQINRTVKTTHIETKNTQLNVIALHIKTFFRNNVMNKCVWESSNYRLSFGCYPSYQEWQFSSLEGWLFVNAGGASNCDGVCEGKNNLAAFF